MVAWPCKPSPGPDSKRAMTFADINLAQRLEAAECAVSVASARARAATAGDSPCREVAGGVVIFNSPDSPFNSAKGMGLEGPVREEDLDLVDAFFRDRGAKGFVMDVCPLADETLGQRLVSRGYGFAGFETVTYRPVTTGDGELQLELPEDAVLDVPGTVDQEEWAILLAKVFSGAEEPPAFMVELGRAFFSTRGAIALCARADGRIVAGAGMNVHGGVAALFGAGTLAPYRGRGLQRAMLNWRLRRAAELGCDLAKVDTKPGTRSQRNVERAGFRVAYTRAQFTKNYES